jgi:hypothetical protein
VDQRSAKLALCRPPGHPSRARPPLALPGGGPNLRPPGQGRQHRRSLPLRLGPLRDVLSAQGSRLSAGGPATVAAYAARRLKANTSERHFTAISQAHQLAGVANPVEDKLVRTAMAGVRRLKGTAQHGKEPLSPELLRQMFTGSPDDLHARRDRALLLGASPAPSGAANWSRCITTQQSGLLSPQQDWNATPLDAADLIASLGCPAPEPWASHCRVFARTTIFSFARGRRYIWWEYLRWVLAAVFLASFIFELQRSEFFCQLWGPSPSQVVA